MSNENHRPLRNTRRDLLNLDRIARRRGCYVEFAKRLQRRASRQARKACFKHTNPDEAWDRIAAIARGLAFDEIPGRQTVMDWWQRAYARWRKLLKGVTGSLAEKAATIR